MYVVCANMGFFHNQKDNVCGEMSIFAHCLESSAYT